MKNLNEALENKINIKEGIISTWKSMSFLEKGLTIAGIFITIKKLKEAKEKDKQKYEWMVSELKKLGVTPPIV